MSTEEVEVLTGELKPGDIITGARLKGAKTWNSWKHLEVVSEPVKSKTYPGDWEWRVKEVGTAKEFTEMRGEVIFRVTRKKQHPLASVFSCDHVAKKIDEYPDTCPRCGLPAYVGAWEVAHKNEAMAKNCPARRK